MEPYNTPEGSDGVTNAPRTIFFLCWRSIARAAVYFGCISAEIVSCGQGKYRFACHPHSFRSEMARARCLRHELPDDHSRADREHRCQRPCPGNGRRRLGQDTDERGICTAAAIRRQAAKTIRSKKARTQTQNYKETRSAVDGPGGAATAICFVWQQDLVSQINVHESASFRTSRAVRFESGIRTKADVHRSHEFPSFLADCAAFSGWPAPPRLICPTRQIS
jgi:hypothetical protein